MESTEKNALSPEELLRSVAALVMVVNHRREVVYANNDLIGNPVAENPGLAQEVDICLATRTGFPPQRIVGNRNEGLIAGATYLERNGAGYVVLTLFNEPGESRKKKIDVNAFVRELESIVREEVPSRTMLNFVLGAAECEIVSDEERLRELMLAYLRSSFAMTPRGSVTFGYELWPDSVYFFVRDTGSGLPSGGGVDYLSRISGTNGVSGLDNAESLVRCIGGEAGVESAGAGKGCKFWVSLPEVQEETQNEDYAQASISFGDTPARSPQAPAGRQTILVAEDNESNYFLMMSMLENEYDIIRAKDGAEAVERWEKDHPDIILMDINMPNIDGYEATRRIRQAGGRVPIIAVTAYAFTSDRVRIMESGFDSYVSKPVNADRLMSELRRCLAEGRKD